MFKPLKFYCSLPGNFQNLYSCDVTIQCRMVDRSLTSTEQNCPPSTEVTRSIIKQFSTEVLLNTEHFIQTRLRVGQCELTVHVHLKKATNVYCLHILYQNLVSNHEKCRSFLVILLSMYISHVVNNSCNVKQLFKPEILKQPVIL